MTFPSTFLTWCRNLITVTLSAMPSSDIVGRIRSPGMPDKRGYTRVSVANLDSFKTFARSCSQNVARIPDGLSDVEAASLPTIFITAYYSLHEVGRLRKTESVSIHSGAGGTGQAAIQVAHHLGAEVFTTVGAQRKKRLVMDLYEIPEDHIFKSRDSSFAQGAERLTKGKGVDVFLIQEALDTTLGLVTAKKLRPVSWQKGWTSSPCSTATSLSTSRRRGPAKPSSASRHPQPACAQRRSKTCNDWINLPS